MNHTLITLIPKIKSPGQVQQYKPISLCNASYKVIAMIVTNHLKGLMPKVISENQSPLIVRRQIHDNILVAYEILHSLKCQSDEKTRDTVIKLDMENVYDRVEWKFVTSMMEKISFIREFSTRTEECISSISYIVLIDKNHTRFIKPSRGLRQGDPRLPFLFLICVEGFLAS